MTDKEMERQIKKAKRFNYTVFAIFAAIVLVPGAWIISYKYQHTFTAERWAEKPEKRAEMVGDLLKKGALSGKTPEEVTALLGEDAGDGVPFKAADNLIYHLWLEDYIDIDSQWLIISFKDGLVSDCVLKIG